MVQELLRVKLNGEEIGEVKESRNLESSVAASGQVEVRGGGRMMSGLGHLLRRKGLSIAARSGMFEAC